MPDATGTQLNKINDRGQAVGNFSTSDLDSDDPANPYRGFLCERGRVSTVIEFPGAVLTRT